MMTFLRKYIIDCGHSLKETCLKKEAAVAIDERVYCPHIRCSVLMSKDEVLEYRGPWGLEAKVEKLSFAIEKFGVDFKDELHNLVANLTISLESKIEAKFIVGITKLRSDLGLPDAMDVCSDNSKSFMKTSILDTKVSRSGQAPSGNHKNCIFCNIWSQLVERSIKASRGVRPKSWHRSC
ncbi:hypothetical protein HS088_TW11G00511 [Tripterygium wilfordii]|uniref:Uncharacterized protein n=1 Tax=Tripterygium wilfordii TaxID=458696 RepID=A0A7J7D257_TRIWF|nr:hypothetical protein HS088_TW11G00511 [Tripterygium wilfordii]